MNDNKKLPSGWGEDDDENLEFDIQDEEANDTPWGNSIKAKQEENKDTPPKTKETENQKESSDNLSAVSVATDTITEPLKPQSFHNQSSTPVHIPTKASKSKAVPILIAIIAILVIALISVGILFLTKNKSDDSDKSESNITEQSTTAPQAEKTTESQTEEVTAATTLPITTETTETTKTSTTSTTTQTTTAPVTLPYEVYEDASIRALDRFMGSYNGSSVNYNLTDVSGDGIPELFIKYNTEAASSSSMYYFTGSDYGEEISIGEGARICTSAHLVEAYGYGGSIVRLIFETNNNGSVILKDKLVIKMDFGTEYLINDISVSESEYTELNNYYDSLKWEDVSRYEYKRANTEPPKKEYTPEEIRNNAGPDFYFFADNTEGRPGSYGRTVNTESGSLNLRAAPSTSADIITQIPKGTYVGELGCNNEWSYISYTDQNGVSYVGYVSSQYLH